MPPKTHDPTKPTVYLDTSTLADAFEGLSVSATSEQRRLQNYVTHVAKASNLVLSYFHLAELTQWEHPEGRARDVWLEGMPVVWSRFFAHVREDEDDHWLALAMGAPDPPAIRVFAPSMLTAFEELTPEGAVDGLRHATVPAMAELLRVEPDVKYRRLGVNFLARFAADQEAIRAAHATPDQVEAEAAYRGSVELRKNAIAAHRRLAASSIAYRQLRLSEGGVQDPFVDFVAKTPSAVPITRVTRAFTPGFADTARRANRGRKRVRKAESAPLDFMHAAIGAAYCDIFTCDEETSAWLGNTRKDLGLSEQIALGGAVSRRAFVQALERAL